ncbi:MAG: hypothetical protein R6X25_06880 [Candidatus Krumholzibacteriia bacterium]
MMSAPIAISTARTDRRRFIQTLGGLAGLLLVGPTTFGCGSKDDPVAPAAAKEKLVLFVPGFMSQLYTAFSIYGEDVINAELRAAARDVPVIGDRIAARLPTIDLPVPSGGFITFDSIERHYDTEGIAYDDMNSQGGFNTQQGVEENGAAIADFLAGSTGKSVTIVSHSKGGLDTLQALLENRGLWGETVTGWIALQPPFAGSPVADNVPAALAGPLLTALGGDEQALLDLQTAPRTEYMADRVGEIAELTAAIPVISCYSTFTASPAQSFGNVGREFASQVLDAQMLRQIAVIVSTNLLDPAQAATEAVALIRSRARQLVATVMSNVPMMSVGNLTMSEANDGLVPVSSVALPGASIRQLTPTADHAAPVMEVTPFKNFWSAARRNDVSSGLVDEVRSGAESSRYATFS